MKILSIDSSTKSSGWSVYTDNKLVEYDCIDLSYIKDVYERIGLMILELYGLISSTRPDVVVVEQTVVQRNPKTQRELTMILGAVFGKCTEYDIGCVMLRPTEWRKLVSAEKKPRKREELKQWSIGKVKEVFDIACDNDDVSDAILIGRAYINMIGG